MRKTVSRNSRFLLWIHEGAGMNKAFILKHNCFIRWPCNNRDKNADIVGVNTNLAGITVDRLFIEL